MTLAESILHGMRPRAKQRVILRDCKTGMLLRAVHEGRSAVDPAVASKLIQYLSGRSSVPATKVPEALTDRELEVLALVAQGLTNRAIGRKLGISDRTVQGHLANVFGKLGASSRTEAVVAAVKLGWIQV